MKNHQQKKDCLSKRAFANKKAAEQSGQRAYRCPVCDYWHRTGPITPVRNPVLRFSLILLMIALVPATVRGSITIGWPVAEIRDAIVANMTSRGYEEVAGGSWVQLYFIHRGTTYHSTDTCTEQRLKFVLSPQVGGKVIITGFGICYSSPYNVTFDDRRIDAIIMDAFKK